MRLRFQVLLLAAAALSCGGGDKPNPRDAADAADTGRTLPARSAAERDILQQVADLPVGAPRTVGDVVVTAEPAYSAASGRTCRALRIQQGKQGQPSHRLACTEGKGWFFVPDVLGLESSAQ